MVVVGLAASPAASAPIGHAAPPAAGGKGRRQQTLPHPELASFLKFEMTIMDFKVMMQVTMLLDKDKEV